MNEFNPLEVRDTGIPAAPPRAKKSKAAAKAETLAAPESDAARDAGQTARDQLRSYVERIERLEEEKKSISDDIKDVYGEAKAMGYDTKVLRKVIAIRKQDQNERAEQEAILDTYLAALGMVSE